MDFWATPFPWSAVDSCIDTKTFEFKGTEQAMENFEKATGLKWDNLHDDEGKKINCPSCKESFTTPWTEGFKWEPLESKIQPGTGFADGGFLMDCPHCQSSVNHDVLRARKFKEDVRLLMEKKIPMAGTVLAKQGQPAAQSWLKVAKFPPSAWPNAFISDRVGYELLNSTYGGLTALKIILEDDIARQRRTLTPGMQHRCIQCG